MLVRRFFSGLIVISLSLGVLVMQPAQASFFARSYRRVYPFYAPPLRGVVRRMPYVAGLAVAQGMRDNEFAPTDGLYAQPARIRITTSSDDSLVMEPFLTGNTEWATITQSSPWEIIVRRISKTPNHLTIHRQQEEGSPDTKVIEISAQKAAWQESHHIGIEHTEHKVTIKSAQGSPLNVFCSSGQSLWRDGFGLGGIYALCTVITRVLAKNPPLLTENKEGSKT